MLSNEEKKELLEMARSATLREEFRTLRRTSEALSRRVSVDDLIHWLTAMSRFLPKPANPRPFVADKNVKI